jgi:hypothetical protein
MQVVQRDQLVHPKSLESKSMHLSEEVVQLPMAQLMAIRFDKKLSRFARVSFLHRSRTILPSSAFRPLGTKPAGRNLRYVLPTFCATQPLVLVRLQTSIPRTKIWSEAMKKCNHLDEIRGVTPSAKGCEECLKIGGWWVHLRLCRICGHVGSFSQNPAPYHRGLLSTRGLGMVLCRRALRGTP